MLLSALTQALLPFSSLVLPHVLPSWFSAEKGYSYGFRDTKACAVPVPG